MTTAWTCNPEFDALGVLAINNLWDPKELVSEIPENKGSYDYTMMPMQYLKEDIQCVGSTARISYPQYKEIHTGIRHIIEKTIGRKLYNTYYYDRFYFPGLELVKHTDRPSCEISVTVNVASTLKKDWPFWATTPVGDKSFITKPGDAVLYKGCEVTHWREQMPSPWFSKNVYYHQAFFHYVLQDGIKAYHAWDMVK